MCKQTTLDLILILISVGGMCILNVIGNMYVVGLIYGEQNLFSVFVGFSIFVCEIIVGLIVYRYGRLLYRKCNEYETIEQPYFSNI
jgi:hypothetical protein